MPGAFLAVGREGRSTREYNTSDSPEVLFPCSALAGARGSDKS